VKLKLLGIDEINTSMLLKIHIHEVMSHKGKIVHLKSISNLLYFEAKGKLLKQLYDIFGFLEQINTYGLMLS